MKFDKTEVMNLEGAFRGLRNPMNSWNKADSKFNIGTISTASSDAYEIADKWVKYDGYSLGDGEEYDRDHAFRTKWLQDKGTIKAENGTCQYAYLGPADINLAQRLITAGPSDAKFLRQIMVSVDITAPMYWLN